MGQKDPKNVSFSCRNCSNKEFYRLSAVFCRRSPGSSYVQKCMERTPPRKLVVQVHLCEQFLEALVFAKIVIPGIYFDVRERRGVFLISLLQKQHDFFPLG